MAGARRLPPSNPHTVGALGWAVVRPTEVVRQNVFRPLQPLETDQRYGREMRVAVLKDGSAEGTGFRSGA
jgi:hypothetical protein